METITINECPYCKKSHSYDLDVERSTIMKFLSPSDRPEPMLPRQFERLFYCPTQKDMFQAKLTLYESSSDRIKTIGQNTILKIE